jgi:hypothetical protein
LKGPLLQQQCIVQHYMQQPWAFERAKCKEPDLLKYPSTESDDWLWQDSEGQLQCVLSLLARRNYDLTAALRADSFH